MTPRHRLLRLRYRFANWWHAPPMPQIRWIADLAFRVGAPSVGGAFFGRWLDIQFHSVLAFFFTFMVA
ncbi:MAG: hypothetical protein HQL35_13400, partial [Alphaproteobacteria bacterium]|nr:hypothetical protein [Alphaproteobacteria bacterium]